MRGRGRTLGLAVAVAMVAAACGGGGAGGGGAGGAGGGGGGGAAGDAGLVRADLARQEATGANVPTTVDGLTRFGADLYATIASPDENVVVSPLSIAIAFAMARAGAAGETAAQIDEVLGFPGGDGTHASYNALDRAMVTDDAPAPAPSPGATRDADATPQPPILHIANGLFAQSGFPIKDAFLQILAGQYGSGMYTVDFAGAMEQALATINGWVTGQTAGRITSLFPQLPGTTRLVLANAIYLKADWATPFAEYPTEDADFTRADGTVKTVPMMHQPLEGVRAATGDGWQAVELPYAGDELAMWVIVPDAGRGLDGLLDPTTLTGIREGLAPDNVDLFLPRWDFATELDLVDVLASLGLTAPFDGGSADFSGISDTPLYIGEAIHKANITVDEWGTEAAAVTGLAFLESAAAQPPRVVRADHPFAYAIVHLPTGAPVFLGHVADPSAS